MMVCTPELIHKDLIQKVAWYCKWEYFGNPGLCRLTSWKGHVPWLLEYHMVGFQLGLLVLQGSTPCCITAAEEMTDFMVCLSAQRSRTQQVTLIATGVRQLPSAMHRFHGYEHPRCVASRRQGVGSMAQFRHVQTFSVSARRFLATGKATWLVVLGTLCSLSIGMVG